MELKERKRINNRLPGFVGGVENGQIYNSSTGKPSNDMTASFSPSNLYGNYSNVYNPNATGGKLLEINIDGTPLKTAKNTQPSSAAGIGPWFALGEWIGTGIGSGINSIRNASDIISDAGRSYGTVNGISYERGNDIDYDAEMKNYKRDLGMSFLTNPFKGLSMAFGLKKQKREMREAQRQQYARNEFNRAGAATQYLQMEYANKYGDPQNQILYAEGGHDAIQTSEGEYKMVPNSRTQGLEIMFNKGKLSAHIIPGSPKTGDSHLTYTEPSDTILSRMYGIADLARPFARALEYANNHEKTKNRGSLGRATDKFVKEQTVPALQNYADTQGFMRSIGLLPEELWLQAKNGHDAKLPGFILGNEDRQARVAARRAKRRLNAEDSWISPNANWWVDGLGMATSLGGAISTALDKIKTVNTYTPNPYGQYMLNKLMSLRINPYNIYNQAYNKEAQNVYATNNMGGLSAAQKQFGNVANRISTQNILANLNAEIQKQNNTYAMNAAENGIKLGAQEAENMIGSNRWDPDYYSKAHASKWERFDSLLGGGIAALYQGYKNRNSRYMFDKSIKYWDNNGKG